MEGNHRAAMEQKSSSQWGVTDSDLGEWDAPTDWTFASSNDSGDQSLYDDSNNKLTEAPVLGSFNRPISLHDVPSTSPKVSARDLDVLKQAAAKRRTLQMTGSNLSSQSGNSKGKSGKKGIMGFFGRVRIEGLFLS